MCVSLGCHPWWVVTGRALTSLCPWTFHLGGPPPVTLDVVILKRHQNGQNMRERGPRPPRRRLLSKLLLNGSSVSSRPPLLPLQ